MLNAAKTMSKKSTSFQAGIWEIIDLKNNQRVSKFRARRKSDIDRALNIAKIGLGRPADDFTAVFLTNWES